MLSHFPFGFVKQAQAVGPLPPPRVGQEGNDSLFLWQRDKAAPGITFDRSTPTIFGVPMPKPFALGNPSPPPRPKQLGVAMHPPEPRELGVAIHPPEPSAIDAGKQMAIGGASAGGQRPSFADRAQGFAHKYRWPLGIGGGALVSYLLARKLFDSGREEEDDERKLQPGT